MPSTPRLPQSSSPRRPGHPALQRVLLPFWVEPAAAFNELYARHRYTVWLDAGSAATTGLSYLAAAHPGSRVVTASAASGTVTCARPLQGQDTPVTTAETVFDFLRRESGPGRSGADADTHDPDAIEFRLGWVGWLGYGLAEESPTGHRGEPDAALLHVDRAIAFDHAARSVTLMARPAPGESAAGLPAWFADTGRRLAALAARGAAIAARPVPVRAAPTQPPTHAPPEVRWRHDAAQYRDLVLACQARIAAGDAYQLCLTNEVTVAGDFDVAHVYQTLRAGSPSHHGGLLRFGPHALLSASPEEFLSVSPHGRLRTRPIKGTRPRAADPAADRRLREELLASDKERAENLMIVDLMRNDLGRVAALGSVAVTGLLQVESYPHVHQLVSTVEARLASGLGPVDAVEACFPAGSMTGAPKASAMGILRTLEGGDRGVYAGAFGYLGDDGAVDLAMVIRSIVLGPAGASIGTGGGITALSVAAEEIEETQVKAQALIQALLAASAAPDPANGQGLVT